MSASDFAMTHAGNITLHMLALARDRKWQWHARGIARELGRVWQDVRSAARLLAL